MKKLFIASVLFCCLFTACKQEERQPNPIFDKLDQLEKDNEAVIQQLAQPAANADEAKPAETADEAKSAETADEAKPAETADEAKPAETAN